MKSSPSPPELIVVGANHRSSSANLRDLMFVPDAAAPAFLQRLRGDGVAQAVVLSTCDRVEVQAAADPDLAAPAIARALAEQASLPLDQVTAELYTHSGHDALKHIFAVAASLASQVIGEPQVLGQVKAGHRLAREAGTVGPELDAALQAAYEAAKRVREETAIAEGPVSMAAAAVQVARDVHGDLARCAGMLIGDGDMGELMAGQLMNAGLARLAVTMPSAGRAEAAARRLDCHVVPFDEFAGALAEADIVLAAAGGRRHLITGEMIGMALKRRRQRPIFLVDTAVPGDVEPAAGRIDQIYLYDLDDLERLAMRGRAGREQSAEAAWKIIGAEVASFERARGERRAVPAITALRGRFEAIGRAVAAEAGGEGPEEIARRLVNRLLHAPSEALRQLAAEGGAAGGGERDAAEEMVRRLFRLDDPAGQAAEKQDDEENGA